MGKNSTVKLLKILIEETDFLEKKTKKVSIKNQLKPKKETLDLIKAYARSTNSVKISSGENLLISLN